ncbi:MAG: TRAM domain-containing protein [Actinobacteria bacterium]|nr:MAG: TRAM domain-containing protein [Actinomycetota bacterium]
MLAEAIRLIFMLAVAVGSAYLGKIWQISFVSKNLALILFIVIGTGIGYVLGGVIGRKLDRTVKWIEEKTQKVSPSELVMGSGGLILGLVVSSLVSQPIKEALSPITPVAVPYAIVLVYFIFGYLGLNIFARKKASLDFFSGISAGSASKSKNNTLVIDSSVAIDGRIAELVKMGFISANIVIPRFIINELQGIADSDDELKRARGRRGLDVLQVLTKVGPAELLEKDYPELIEPDDKLIQLSSDLGATLATNDYNLSKVAALEKIKVLNINELAIKLRPVVLPGETLKILLVKKGKEKGQAVGYLEDGTMLVVESAQSHIGSEVEATVTSILQTSAGKMMFAKLVKGAK